MPGLISRSPTQLVIVPTFNTGPKLLAVVAEIVAHWQPVWVVVDGSTDGSEARVLELARTEPGLRVIRLERNTGKGGAVLHAAELALAEGFTHALVMDADGQHPAESIAEFMEVSRRAPDALVIGRPIFGPEVPLERLHCRKLSTLMVRAEILGPGVDDSLFGFRVYPLEPLWEILGPRKGGRRYDFETEAAVRLLWAGVRPLNVAAPVKYFSKEEGGVSHFHYLRDNIVLVDMHVKLLAELLLWRWPGVLRARRRWREAGRRQELAAAAAGLMR